MDDQNDMAVAEQVNLLSADNVPEVQSTATTTIRQYLDEDDFDWSDDGGGDFNFKMVKEEDFLTQLRQAGQQVRDELSKSPPPPLIPEGEEEVDVVEMIDEQVPFKVPSGPDTLENAHQEILEQTQVENLQHLPPLLQDRPEVVINLSERQKLAYVSLVYLCLANTYTGRDSNGNERTIAFASAMNFARRLLRKLYVRMNISPEEQKMIEKMNAHQLSTKDLARTIWQQKLRTCSLTRSISIPIAPKEGELSRPHSVDCTISSLQKHRRWLNARSESPKSSDEEPLGNLYEINFKQKRFSFSPIEKIKKEDEEEEAKVQGKKDIRSIILTDLFLIIVTDGAYDSRGRILLRQVAQCLDVSWWEVTEIERDISRQVVETLAETLEGDADAVGMAKTEVKTGARWAIMGLATVGGGLLLGLSAGLLAPVIGAGIAAGLTGIGVAGSGAFLGHAGGVALITTGGVLTGGGLANSKMRKRIAGISHFRFQPLHDEQRTNVIISISGMLSQLEDFWLPFSTIDAKMMGDVVCLEWEPEMLTELNNVLKLLAGELVGQAIQTALGHTLLSTLMAGLSWPLALTKLGYLVDNPWSVGLDRARKAGLLLADVLINHHHGYRPVTLIGYSLGARVIFYALLELARMNAFGIIEDVFMFGAPVTATEAQWESAASVVAGRFLNGYHKNDWVLGFLYRTVVMQPIAGLTAINFTQNLENFDASLELKGHLGYRYAMPRLLQMVGVAVTGIEIIELLTEEERALKEKQEREEADKAFMQQVVDDLREVGCQVKEIPSTQPKMVLMGGGRPIKIVNGTLVLDEDLKKRPSSFKGFFKRS